MSEIQYGFNESDFEEQRDSVSVEPYKGGATIKMARMVHGDLSAGAKSQGVEFTFELEDKRTAKVTTWYMSKIGKTTYTDKQGKEQPLMGGNQLKSILTVCDAQFVVTDNVMVDVYDFDQKKDVPTSSSVLGTVANKPLLVSLNTSESMGNNGSVYTQYDLAQAYNATTQQSSSEMKSGKEATAFEKATPRAKKLQGGGATSTATSTATPSGQAQGNPFAK